MGYSLVPVGQTFSSQYSVHCKVLSGHHKSDPVVWDCYSWPDTHQSLGAKNMSKEQKSNKENKKKPAMTPKEKKAAKKSKKESNGFLG